jgi:uncharacterized membrane protein YhaH (DUF805 family)
MLFSPTGRLTRAAYWLASIGLLVAALVLGLITFAIHGRSAAPSAAVGVFLLATGVFSALVWVGFVLAIKRLHDRDKSGWWVLVFYVGPSILQGVGNSTTSVIPNLIGFGISIWGFVELGFLRGTPGQNNYGPDPLAEPVISTT